MMAPRDALVSARIETAQSRVRLSRPERLTKWIALFFIVILVVAAALGLARSRGTDILGSMVSGGALLLDRAVTAALPSLGVKLVATSQKGAANELLPLGLSLTGVTGGETVVLNGFAAGIELSLGTSQGEAGWLLLDSELDKTFVSAPPDFVGAKEAVATLRAANGHILDRQVVRLEWLAKDNQPAKDNQQDTPRSVARLEVRPLSPEQTAALIKQGQNRLSYGDIASARLLLARAADAGSAQAALELSKSYDPLFLAQWKVRGVVPNPALAREWYVRAGNLGSSEAAHHLDRLERSARSATPRQSPQH